MSLAPRIVITTKRVMAISIKYDVLDNNMPDLSLNHRINANFHASATGMEMRVAGIDDILEDGLEKRIFHLVSSKIQNQEEKERACRRALRRRLRKDVIREEDTENPPRKLIR